MDIVKCCGIEFYSNELEGLYKETSANGMYIVRYAGVYKLVKQDGKIKGVLLYKKVHRPGFGRKGRFYKLDGLTAASLILDDMVDTFGMPMEERVEVVREIRKYLDAGIKLCPIKHNHKTHLEEKTSEG